MPDTGHLPTRAALRPDLDADAYKGEIELERATGETGYYATPYHVVHLTRDELLLCIQLIDNDAFNRRMETR